MIPYEERPDEVRAKEPEPRTEHDRLKAQIDEIREKRLRKCARKLAAIFGLQDDDAQVIYEALKAEGLS